MTAKGLEIFRLGFFLIVVIKHMGTVRYESWPITSRFVLRLGWDDSGLTPLLMPRFVVLRNSYIKIDEKEKKNNTNNSNNITKK